MAKAEEQVRNGLLSCVALAARLPLGKIEGGG
jgi:hypothetical protein